MISHEELGYRIGNITVFFIFIASFLLFVVFSVGLINKAITVDTVEIERQGGFHAEAFEKITPLFQRNGGGGGN